MPATIRPDAEARSKLRATHRGDADASPGEDLEGLGALHAGTPQSRGRVDDDAVEVAAGRGPEEPLIPGAVCAGEGAHVVVDELLGDLPAADRREGAGVLELALHALLEAVLVLGDPGVEGGSCHAL